MKSASSTRRKRWLVILVCVVLTTATVFWMFIGPRETITLLRDRDAFRNRISEFIEAMPAVLRNPLRKVKYRLLGRPKTLVVDAVLLRFTNGTESAVAHFGQPLRSESDGTKFWIVADLDLQKFRAAVNQVPGAEIFSSPKMGIISGHAVLATPMPDEGIVVEALPRVGRNHTDLSLRVEALSLKGTTLTNLLVAARVQLPSKSGILIVKGGANPTALSTGVFALPTIFPSK